MSASRVILWRRKAERGRWQRTGDPVPMTQGFRAAADNNQREIAAGTLWRYTCFPEGTDPND